MYPQNGGIAPAAEPFESGVPHKDRALHPSVSSGGLDAILGVPAAACGHAEAGAAARAGWVRLPVCSVYFGCDFGGAQVSRTTSCVVSISCSGGSVRSRRSRSSSADALRAMVVLEDVTEVSSTGKGYFD